MSSFNAGIFLSDSIPEQNEESAVPEGDERGKLVITAIRTKIFFRHVASERTGLNISGSKNSSLEASSGSVLNADFSLFAFKLYALIMVKWP